MFAFVGTVGLLMLTSIIGKTRKKLSRSTFIFVVVISTIEVAVVLYYLYTMGFPPMEAPEN